MSITRHHNEWLSLIPNSGPFLSLPVLAQSFPQGLDSHDSDHARRLRLAFDEWYDNQLGKRPDPGLHRAWVKFVLSETLGYDELLAEGQAIPQTLKSDVAEYGETLKPDWIVNDPTTKKARLIVQIYPRSQSLTKPVSASRWKVSPDTRMMQLLHDTGIRLGLVTNGDHWMLVNAPKDETTGYASWYANLWLEEKDTLRAFRTLLGFDRLFSVPENETLEALLEKSASDQQEVTDQLGYQVRKAVEVLIQALDKADQEHGRKLLADVNEKVLYESALTVMMRLVFLFCAEERDLLLLGDELYDKNYAVSTLREQLRVTADQFGEEILGLRYDAWTRLLTTFRTVYAGAKHDRLKLPAYGGSLFNPDRFPFLEGREFGTSWKNTEATPLPINNRTILHLLEALQVLQTKIGKTIEARKLSFRSLDIEQIGHVYEGLLDHTAKRASEPMLGLAGTRHKEPEIALADLEKVASKGEKELLKLLKEESGRSESAIKKGLSSELEDQLVSRFRTACQDTELWNRVRPYAGAVRFDDVGYPVVITSGSVFVTSGTDRRSSGTHYTPKSLTEPIVQYTLEPLVYIGPAEGLPREEWKLRSARELLALKICDMACGSGAFLVQVCRYLSARLLEAWDAIQKENVGSVRITPEGEPSTGKPSEMLIPDDPDERQTYALRIVAQRCVYGVDINPLAVEMAKLSLWLLTLAKDKPFEFLDHNIRCGDSLVGIHHLDQLRKFSLKPDEIDQPLFSGPWLDGVEEAIALRLKLEEMPTNSVEDVQRQEKLLKEANEKLVRLRCAADLLVAAEFWATNAKDRLERQRHFANIAIQYVETGPTEEFEQIAAKERRGQSMFHWPLEFPEVIVKRGGFDAFVGNPPFMGGQKITGAISTNYRSHLVHNIAFDQRGSADLCTYFILHACDMLSNGSHVGFLATNTLSQGDTREVGLAQLTSRSFSITRAVPSMRWPGAASLEVSQIWIRRGVWNGIFVLNNHAVESISSYLSPPDAISRTPFRLKENTDNCFIGCYVQGAGFILTEKESSHFLKDAKYSDVIFPYINGQELNTLPDHQPCRWIISFSDWPLNRSAKGEWSGASAEVRKDLLRLGEVPGDYPDPVATDYPAALAVVEERVKPERTRRNPSGEFVLPASMVMHWWNFKRTCPSLNYAIQGKKRIIAKALTSKHHAFAFLPSGWIYDQTCPVVTSESAALFAVLQSDFHMHWALAFGASLETRPRYTPSDCFETFPFPELTLVMDQLGEEFHEHRRKAMIARSEGLTALYNRFHNRSETSADIRHLRALHETMVRAVLDAYQWNDIPIEFGYRNTRQCSSFTISDCNVREITSRLLKLNHDRHAKAIQGATSIRAKAKTTSRRKGRSIHFSDLTLPGFDDGIEEVGGA